MKHIALLFICLNVVYSQEKSTDNQRYQIIQVDKIEESAYPSSNTGSEGTATAKKTIFLLDTKLGRCWVLKPISSKVGENQYFQEYEWSPISFSVIPKGIDTKKFLPPKF